MLSTYTIHYYIIVPHSMRVRCTVYALRFGFHILCVFICVSVSIYNKPTFHFPSHGMCLVWSFRSRIRIVNVFTIFILYIYMCIYTNIHAKLCVSIWMRASKWVSTDEWHLEDARLNFYRESCVYTGGYICCIRTNRLRHRTHSIYGSSNRWF